MKIEFDEYEIELYFPVKAVIVSKGIVPMQYNHLPLLNEGFDFALAHKLGLSGVIRVYDCFFEATRFIDVGEETFTYTPLGSVEISDKDLKSLPRTKRSVLRSKKVDVPTEQWQKDIERQFTNLRAETEFIYKRLTKLEDNQ